MYSPPLTARPLAEVLDLAAAEVPAPGGGSAAALGSALAAALVAMVCRYTQGRERFADVDRRVREVLREVEDLRRGLTGAVDEDADAYSGYARARKLPRGSDEEVAARETAMRLALESSTLVPLRVARMSVRVLELALAAAELGSPQLVSDAAVAAELADAGRRAALVNVRLNARQLADDAFGRDVRAQAAAAEEASGLRQRVVDVAAERSG